MFRLLLLFSFLFLAAANATSLTGEELVHAEFPRLHEAFVSTLGPEKSEQFFRQWWIPEVDFLSQKLQSILKKLLHPQKNMLKDAYAKNVIGMLTETYANRRLRENGHGTFMDEISYAHLNKGGKKPDGLVYRIEKDRLILLLVFECKITGAYLPGQAAHYLRWWRRHGMTVRKDGVPVFFPPTKIDVKDRPVRETSLGHLESHTVLISARNVEIPNFAGQTIQLPLTRDEVYKAARAYLESIWISFPEWETPTPEAKKPTKDEEAQQEVEINFPGLLNHFVVEHGDWPVAKIAENLKLVFLRREVSIRGGQAPVFVDVLSDAAKRKLVQSRRLPVPFNLQKLLEKRAPEPKTLSALYAYIKVYSKAEALLASLAAVSDEWRTYLGSHDVQADATRWLAEECATDLDEAANP